MTQTHLAKKLHVTDKAVSRWERGIGLPDINSIEALAKALGVSLVELMQAKRNENEHISTKEAENLMMDTIELSKITSKVVKGIGSVILSGFALVAILLLLMLVSDGEIVLFSVGSIIAGLIAWGIPIWQISYANSGGIVISIISSLGFTLISLMIQFLNIANEVHTGDWAAIEDTIDALIVVIILFVSITMFLNVTMTKIVTKRHRFQK
ncbi:helix-turn-helix transcriptional regulator [Proteiniclasticum sp. SCR006]|uniref:Helix-turn-helix transcriptional regulator n=1 Tax=Proteiniclasticum aestuarii TaxID=2817862 RepID=A0A939HDD3_9CLOT|nr:helix-turn-helix transcriptional regulator [Proteiniclasticum aestuarii]